MTTPVTLEYVVAHVPESMVDKETGRLKKEVLQELTKGTTINVESGEIYSCYSPFSDASSEWEYKRFQAGRFSIGLDSILHETVLDNFKILKGNVEAVIGSKIMAEYYSNRLSNDASYTLYDENGAECGGFQLGGATGDGMLADACFDDFRDDYESLDVKVKAISSETITTFELGGDSEVKLVKQVKDGSTSLQSFFVSQGFEYGLGREMTFFFDGRYFELDNNKI